MFIFENKEGRLLLRDEFVLSCEFVKNLFEDTGETDPATPILFSNNYSLSHLKNMEQFFIELQNIHINFQKTCAILFIKYTQFLMNLPSTRVTQGIKPLTTFQKKFKVFLIKKTNSFLTAIIKTN